ncbi:HD-GYP domain-containing protein [Aromatoleum petrolei]|uniref:HD domain-containing protein n=1 Tax=Aromatoleum petrolei TaxID=76116 RepID=A0ABX1MZC5_9RHOO|nr:HD domain-containing phosphohydrolase [Aromatoleum petrolei]NMF91409.1 HD domain-containing protein [Aromatoleum petrolei]QTQ34612.1 Putative response regulator protein [Aromatoleum petrolei]
MNSFNRRVAWRIGFISVLLGAVASLGAWVVAYKNAEDATVALATEESRRLLRHSDALELSGPDAGERARKAVKTLAGGLFDVAEVYNSHGEKLASAMTPEGQEIEAQLPSHPRPGSGESSHQSLKLDQGRRVLRVFVPLKGAVDSGTAEVHGYFEGVRVLPPWQRQQMLIHALSGAVMVGLASLLCGATIYPVVVLLSADNERKAREILDSHLSLMEALGRAVGKRDSDTGDHNFRVAWMAARIGERLGLSDRAMQSLIVGAFLHDIGKISIPDAILHKPDRLDSGESEIMRTHVAQGEEIVSHIGWLDEAKAIVAAHHEKWDGSGYPRQLAGDAIPLSARIFAVADVFDSLCSKRPYKEALDFDAAMSIMDRDTGRHFDPRVMSVFRPIAWDLFEALEGGDDQLARRRLEDCVRRHFGI